MFALTNLDSQGQDGTGAQVLRFLIHFGLSRKYKIPFRYQEIKQIDSNPGDSFETQEEKMIFLKKLNQVLAAELILARKEKSFFIRKIFSKLQLHFFLKLIKIFSRFLKPRYLLSFNNCITYSPLLSDTLPQYTLQFLQKSTIEVKPHELKSKNPDLNIAIHIRGALKTNQRFVPAELYKLLEWLESICEKREIRANFFIHTDAPPIERRWKPLENNYHGTIASWSKFNLLDKSGATELIGYNFEANFDSLRSLKVLRDIDPIDAWTQIANCQVFIGCNSSFSIVASLLSNPMITILPPIDNFTLPVEWIESTPTYKLDDSDKIVIEQKIQDFAFSYSKGSVTK